MSDLVHPTSHDSSLRALRFSKRLRRTCAALASAVLLTSAARPAHAVLDPAVSGQWDPPRKWPAVAVHLVLMHTGKLLFFRGDQGGFPTYVWDPQTEAITSKAAGADIFCSGQSVLPDGRVFVTGGDTQQTNIFNPVTETWSRGPDMRQRRFYPSNVTLGDGRVLIFSGRASSLVEIVESYTPGAAQIDMIVGANRKMEFYPRLFRLPSGKVVYVGEEPTTAVLDPATGVWQVLGNSKFGNRYEGNAVLLPPGHEKIMIAGGEGGTNTAEIIDMSAAAPAWRSTTPMNYAHDHVQSVILPTGKVVVAGGSTLNVEEFDPATETWTVMAPLATKREYHSTAVLLPDGRVVWAGTNGNPSREVFSPPYLFRGPRPVIGAAPASVQYGDTFQVTTSDAGSIASVVFIRPGASTHSWNMEQRYVPLAFSQTGPDTLSVAAPTQGNIAHPGYYLLFLVNGDGIPSVAPFVLLGGTPAEPPTTTSTLAPAGSTSTTTSTVRTTTTSTSTTSTTLPAGARTVEVRVAASTDDAEEDPNGLVDLASGDLELVQDADMRQVIGIRFAALNLPPGATIYRAWVQFAVDEANSEDTSVRISAEAGDSPPTFTAGTSNVSARPRTTASVPWDLIPAWPTIGAVGMDQRTPDLATVVQEIVNRPGWLSGNSLVLLMSGTGHRTAESYDGSKTTAPLLHVDYGLPTTTTSTSTSSSSTSSTSTSSTSTSSTLSSTSTSTTNVGTDPTTTSSTTATTDPGPGSSTTSTTTTTVPTAPITVERRISASSDDAEENTKGSMKLTNSGLELVRDSDDQTVGFRFTGLNVPAGATIVNAWAQFTAHKAGTTATSLRVAGEAADNPPTFTTATRSVSSRTRTAASVPWGPVLNWTTGSLQRTGDLTAIVQEIVGRPGWQSGNALVLILTGTGQRIAKSFDTAPASAAMLHVEYRPGTSTTTTTIPGATTTSTTLPPGGTTVQVRVKAIADDAEESPSGAVDLSSSDLELVHDTLGDQVVGMRFTGVNVPPGVTVRRAWIQFAVDEANTETTNLRIDGEATDDAPVLASSSRNLSLRPRTSASAAWDMVPEWRTIGAAGADQQTSDIAAVIQEIVGRPGWRAGNALVLLVTGSGHRTAESYDGSKTTAPLLHVEY